ncbi:hydroxymethylbilane synthase [Derxia gummosa]|uniref:Porphobilinogen deaminase n=1 Tax=Derxia gummosa DSM 723 TaxID=1121388 RepID=A0A8B6X3D5_9BURK|nr:hydroxymethylbilane synthase [Derxia gummosa]
MTQPLPVPPARLVIASRESRLAMWQAEHVRERLQALYPQCEVSILGMTTRGDQILDRSLSKIGGKGLFVKELENALADGRADLAVHSLKDVPMVLPEGFELTAIMEREDPHDAFVSPRYASLAELPAGAVVGTSSLRRAAAISARFPRLRIEPLRGNLDTRLGKLDRGEYDAIVLAAAGLKRLGLGERIRAVLSPDESLPAAGQGALGIEIRAGRPELAAWLAPLHHAATAACVGAEREVARALGGSCQTSLAAHAVIDGGRLKLRSWVSSPDGRESLSDAREGSVLAVVAAPAAAAVTDAGAARIDEAAAAAIGAAAAADLLANGAARFIAPPLADEGGAA